MGESVKENLNYIVNAHPQGVRLLFEEFGINAPVTYENLENAVLVYKEPFIQRLGEMVYSNFTPDTSQLAPMNYKPWDAKGGDTTSTGTGAPKGNFWNGLEKALGIAGQGVGVWNTFKSGQTPGQPQNGAPQGSTGTIYPNQPVIVQNGNVQRKQPAEQSKTMLYVGLGLFGFLILLVLIVLLTKKQ